MEGGQKEKQASSVLARVLPLVVPNDVPVLLAVTKEQFLAWSNFTDGAQQVPELSVRKHHALSGVVSLVAFPIVDETCLKHTTNSHL